MSPCNALPAGDAGREGGRTEAQRDGAWSCARCRARSCARHGGGARTGHEVDIDGRLFLKVLGGHLLDPGGHSGRKEQGLHLGLPRIISARALAHVANHARKDFVLAGTGKFRVGRRPPQTRNRDSSPVTVVAAETSSPAECIEGQWSGRRTSSLTSGSSSPVSMSRQPRSSCVTSCAHNPALPRRTLS